jgi:hypothetical protein
MWHVRAVRGWEQRTSAVADMLNPALLAAITAGAASEYQRRAQEPMPFPLAFITPPLVLHYDTRRVLPSRVDSHLSKWVVDHPAIVVGFGARARALVDPVREGIRFGLRTRALTLEEGALVGRTRGTPARLGDVRDIMAKAGFTGRWFTQSDSPATVFALLGVEP